MNLARHIIMLLVSLGAFSFSSISQTCEGFHMSGIKCQKKAIVKNLCTMHEIQQYHYCRFTKTVDKGIINQFIRVHEYDIEGLKKSNATKLAKTIKIEQPDTINITNNGLELAFGNFNEYKKHYLKHIHIEPYPGKPGHVKIIMSYAKLEKWM